MTMKYIVATVLFYPLRVTDCFWEIILTVKVQWQQPAYIFPSPMVASAVTGPVILLNTI